MTEIPLFVYGTLMRGGAYHHLMLESGGRFLGSASLVTPYPLVYLDYPCLLDKPGEGDTVSGELFGLPGEASWALIDKLEGHPDEYRRRLEPVDTGDRIVEAWVYFYIQSA